MTRAAAVCCTALVLAAASSACGATTALVTLTAFDVDGAVASANLTQRTGSTCLGTICSDAYARYAFGRVYVINRFGCDNIQVLDPQNDFATIQQFSVGNGSNPQDIALVNPRRAYVSRYGSADLWIVDPATGAHTGTISLAQFADADGLPEAAQMLVLGGRLFVALQRLDRNNFFTPTDTSLVAVIDTATNALVDCDASRAGTQAIVLTGTNPVTDLTPTANGAILLGEVGDYGVLDGGVDAIDRVALQATGFRITESVLGGDIGDVDVFSATTAYAIVADASFATHLREFDPAAGTVRRTLADAAGYDYSHAAIDRAGQVLLADRSSGSTAGVRFFDVATGAEQVSHRLTYCLPPYAIVSLEEPATTVPEDARGLASLRVTSNRVVLTLAEREPAIAVEMFSVDGRRTQVLFTGPLERGEHIFFASDAPRGVYHVAARTARGVVHARAALTR